MKLLIKILFNGLAVFIAAYITPGVRVESFMVAIIVAVVLGILNTLLKPVLLLLTLPINIITLGLFTLVVNVIIVFLASSIVPGFNVSGLLPALIFSFVLTVVNWFLSFFK